MNNHRLITDYYVAHRDELLAFASSRLGGSDEAEDIVQNVFLRLLTTDKMISEVTLPCLVYTMMRNLIIDYYRKRATREELEHYIKRSQETGDGSQESVLSAQEIMERLEHGMARLPEGCREVYCLHIYGGMKVSEISQQLGEGYKRVEHRLGTARRVMRQYLRRYAS